MVNKIHGSFKEENRNKYLALVPTNESQEKVKTYEELWIKIRNSIGSITKKSDDFDEKYIKIEFDSDDNFPLSKTIKIHVMVIIVRAIFHKNHKYYSKAFLGECLYGL